MKQYRIYIKEKEPIIIYGDAHEFLQNCGVLSIYDNKQQVGLFNWKNIDGLKVVNLQSYGSDGGLE